MSMIEFQHVTRTFPHAPRPAVDDVSLSIPGGSFVTLLGPSGCGKTTLLKMVNRLSAPTAGRILVAGEDTAAVSPTTLRRGIGYVIQQTGLFPHLRIEDNIAAVPRLLGWDKRRLDRRVDEMLDLVNLPPTYRRRYPRQLSGGEQQRVGVARALAADPPIVLMDEPFGALDAINRTRLQDELLAIQTRLHKTILFVTHDVDEAFKLGDQIVVMQEGRIVQAGPPLALATAPASPFVRTLLGADDLLRRLALLPVTLALTPSPAATPGCHPLTPSSPGLPPAPDLPTVPAHANLAAALALLLQTGAPSLAVVDEAGVTLGALDLAGVRHALSLP
jgi:osmoprotectant transport system ATP-binding protein